MINNLCLPLIEPAMHKLSDVFPILSCHLQRKCRFFKKCKIHSGVDWVIGTTSTACEKPVQLSQSNREEAAPESGGLCFQAFVLTASRGRGAEGMTGV